MNRNIITDPMFLQLKSEPATKADMQVADDLMDTLNANRERCVGLAANMIGERKRILVAAVGPFAFTMINPVITKKSGKYETEEGCLSLPGVRHCVRYREIEVDFFDRDMKPQHGKYTDLAAQIIQHEMDHFEGILI